jgi:N-terminal domain of anti-restriction factor ArdC
VPLARIYAPASFETGSNQIVAMLEKGVVPWRSPILGQGKAGHPKNLESGKPYRGVNVFLLAFTAWAQAQDIRQGKPGAIIVLSMVGKNYRLTHDMKEAAAALKLPLASKSMILRQIYADAPGQGRVVWQMGSRAQEAAREVAELFREILPQVHRKKLSPRSHVAKG